MWAAAPGSSFGSSARRALWRCAWTPTPGNWPRWATPGTAAPSAARCASRVTRPGGIVFVAFTNWLSPWGGHETSPWHYLGGERAARRYQRRHGKPPKNRYGRSLYPVSVADALDWARAAPEVVLVDAVPRYLPDWTRPLLRVPVMREFLTWNLLLVLQVKEAAQERRG